MVEVIGKYKDDCGNDYAIEKKVAETIYISLVKEARGQRKVLSTVHFCNIGKEYTSPFLSWYNLFFCSNIYGCAPDYTYMQQAVQNGHKTAATVYIEPGSPQGKALMCRLPKDCGSMPYGESMIYVFHKGSLREFFDLEEVKSVYMGNDGNRINWAVVSEYFKMPLSYFGDEQQCGFSLQNGGDKEQSIVTGLILGYPVESTVAWLRDQIS